MLTCVDLGESWPLWGNGGLEAGCLSVALAPPFSHLRQAGCYGGPAKWHEFV